jgi:hypothetical protein
MELTKELEKLKAYYFGLDVEKFKIQYKLLKDNFTSEPEIKRIDEFMHKIAREASERDEKEMEEIRLRCHLILNREIIPFSYIANNYFSKSKEWLYQRLNGNLVNGKPAKFTSSEIETFNFALQDISKKIGSIA